MVATICTSSYQLLQQEFNYYNCICFFIYCIPARKTKFAYYVIVTGPPVIKQPQQDNYVPLKEGSSYNISCRAVGYGSLTYYWERKDSEKWITVDNNNKTSYKPTTTGQYRCNVTNEAGSVVSPVITVYGELL